MERIALRYLVVLSLGFSSAACGTAPESSFSGVPGTQGQPIIYGEPATSDAYQSTGALLMRDSLRDGSIAGSLCSGILIAPDTVLTAAHCVLDNASRRQFFFFIGNDARPPMGTRDLAEGPLLHEAGGVMHHERYNPRATPGLRTANDVALIFLREPVLNVDPATLLKPDESRLVRSGAALDIVGFGVRTPPERGATDDATGEKYYARSVVGEVSRYELQAGTWLPTPQKCHGDSGGPSFLTTPQGPRLVGITSRAYDQNGCTRGGVDTRVDAYYGWIQRAMEAACKRHIRGTCYPLQ